jgi:threonine/homoserine/homoserine lactone efflux protein
MSPGIAAFILAAVLIELTPGPNMTWLAIVAASEGRARGFASVAGVSLGLAVVGVAAALGLGALIVASPWLFQTLRWAGAVYLLWLAWDAWRDALDAPEVVQTSDGLARYFRRGFVVNVLNPKAAVFYMAVLPGFIQPDADLARQVIVLTLIYVGVATLIHAGIVSLAGALQPLLISHDAFLVVRRILAVALALVAVWFLWATAS